MRLLLLTAALLLTFILPVHAQESFTVEKLADGVYAAIAREGSEGTTNAFFVVGREYVLVGGAHFTRTAIDDLVAAVAEKTAKPIRYFVLAHHHAGYSHIDFDFPPEVDVIMSWQTWQGMQEEVRKVGFQALFFREGLTLKVGAHTVILNNVGKGHTAGDLLVFLPESRVLFTSDLLYVKSVGYMGEGYMEDWVLALEFLGQLDADRIIPGYGPVAGAGELAEFKTFFKAFLTSVLDHIERGDTLEETLHTFTLPRYREYEGYDRFLRTNVERAYRQMKATFSD